MISLAVQGAGAAGEGNGKHNQTANTQRGRQIRRENKNVDKYIWTGNISFLFLRGVTIYGIRGEVGR